MFRNKRLRMTTEGLHGIVHRLLREAAGSEKSLELVSNLQRINADAEEMGLRFGIVMERSAGGGATNLSFALRQKNNTPKPLQFPVERQIEALATGEFFSLEHVTTRVPWGSIIVGPLIRNNGLCQPLGEPEGKRPWKVLLTQGTKKGWGPLLYDLAMEIATTEGGGLMSDRNEVSSDAKVVWSAYNSSRPDVASEPLDIDAATADYEGVEQRTPNDDRDDCDQLSAVRHMGDDWHLSPLSRVYRKDPIILRLLMDPSIDLLWGFE